MGFPQDFPKPALNTMLGLFQAEKPNTEVIALAAYELVGYGLGLYFGDTKYPMGIDLGKLLQILQSEEFAKAKEAILEFKALKDGGMATWRAVFKILFKYGPSILNLVLKAIELAK